jgi:hypothetical protein
VAASLVDPPQFCPKRGAKAAYIRVHGAGWRSFTVVHGPEAGCTTAPPAQEPGACPRIDLWSFAESIKERLASRRVSVRGHGLGVCYEPSRASWDDSRYSIMITDWRAAGLAVEIVAGELERWGMAEHFGVSVEAQLCVVPG